MESVVIIIIVSYKESSQAPQGGGGQGISFSEGETDKTPSSNRGPCYRRYRGRVPELGAVGRGL